MFAESEQKTINNEEYVITVQYDTDFGSKFICLYIKTDKELIKYGIWMSKESKHDQFFTKQVHKNGIEI